jgi:serine/threonine protein kinase
MRPAASATPLPPDTICGYTVLRSLSPQTYIALADGGRQVFLKPLDPDCLLQGQLHPSIKERLARVRELALKSAANLHGVERDQPGVFLVWEFIDGATLESYAPSLAPLQLIALMREVVLSVEALHQVGIVHGAIHARNIIVDPTGRPRLTHISPLLFHDPAVDEKAISLMLAKLIDDRHDIDASLRVGLHQSLSLRQLAARLVTADAAPSERSAIDAEDRRRRRGMLLMAVFVAVLGILTAAVVGLISLRP